MVSPHQLSTEAKQLIRNGISEASFVKEINEKGYYKDSKQLDQEVDFECYIHIAKQNGKAYLTVQRGKHRLSSILPDNKKYFVLEFPKNGMPIPEDTLELIQGYDKIPSGTSVVDDGIFSV